MSISHGNRPRRCLRALEAVHTARLANCSENLNSCLISACYVGRADLVETLLDHGASPQTRDANGKTVLQIAWRYGNRDIAKLLTDKLSEYYRENEE